MTSSTSISVLIPTFNRASFLPRTIASVFGQSVHVDEVWLVDDGSTDDTEAVVQSLMSRHPQWSDRCKYLRQENQGKSVALNRALERARGEWLAFLDSDDVWLPTKLEMQLAALARYPECGACFTETSRGEFGLARTRQPARFGEPIGSFGKLSDPARAFIGKWQGISMVTVLVNRHAMARCGKFDPRLRIEQDVDFLFRLGLVTDMCYVDMPLVTIDRDVGRQVGLMAEYPPGSIPRLRAREIRLSSWLELLADERPELSRDIRAYLWTTRSGLANRLELEGHRREARELLWRWWLDSGQSRFLAKWGLSWLAPRLLTGRAKRYWPAGRPTLPGQPAH